MAFFSYILIPRGFQRGRAFGVIGVGKSAECLLFVPSATNLLMLVT